jgi:hypothetical protein
VADEVDADGVIAPKESSQLELGAHAVGAGHQHRLAVLACLSGRQAEMEEASEGPNAGQHLGPAGAPHQLLDTTHQALGSADIDARRRVGGPFFLALVQGVHPYRGN